VRQTYVRFIANDFLASEPQRISNRLEHGPPMVRSQDAVPIEKGGRFHDDAPFATFETSGSMRQVLMPDNV
jgi:hypothetical protein